MSLALGVAFTLGACVGVVGCVLGFWWFVVSVVGKLLRL